MTARGIRKLVVAGGGTAGWMAAAALAARMLPRVPLTVTLIESEAIGTVGVGESTLPSLVRLHDSVLNLDEADFMRSVGATIKVAIRFDGWGGRGQSYFHPFHKPPAEPQPIAFHHFWLHGLTLGDRTPFDAYSREAAAARAGVFDKPGLTHAYHIDASDYAAYLRRYAEARGVHRIEGRIERAVLDPDGETIDALVLADGRRIEADFFIDCTGFRGVLIEQALKAGYEDWSRFLPCDRAVAVPAEQDGIPGPFTRAIARPHGWQWRIPLRHRSGNGYVYCSALCSDDHALDLLLDDLEGEPLAEPMRLRFAVGRRRLFWTRNCVAIGLSAGFLEPLEATGIFLIQDAILRFMQLFPEHRISPVRADAFNRLIGARFEEIRDFLMLHYHANQRDDSPLWTDFRRLDLPESLRRRIELFRSCGQVLVSSENVFTASSWTHVMIGQNVIPANCHPAVAASGAEANARLLWALARRRRAIREAVERMPAHSAFLSRIGRDEVGGGLD